MKTPRYSSFEDINNDLKILNLERQIAREEIRHLGGKVKESFTPKHLLSVAFSSLKDNGIYYLIRRILK